ncbi:MAG TPA: response regulator transcription factor [Acidimicrobiia bacterium]
MASPLLLIAEDDRGVRESLARALEFEGYVVKTAPDGVEALRAIAAEDPDAVILDVMMPGFDGMEVARKVRAKGNAVPILMLTARHEVGDRVQGLDAGADDYLVKPFSLDELLARIRALLRRGGVSGERGSMELADLRMDPAARTVSRGDRQIDLTKTEFDLLELLVFNQGIVVTRDVIYDRIWGYDFETTSNSLDVYIGYLRRKLESAGEQRLVHTVRGVGYVARER